jgi:hypothetical protein
MFMRSRVLISILVAAIAVCFATSASAFGSWGGWEWPKKDEEPVIKLDTDWDFEWPKFSDFDSDGWEWPEKEDGEYSDWEWPDKDECWFCDPKGGDGPRSAIPEPTAALLFAGGALVIASRRRRNR